MLLVAMLALLVTALIAPAAQAANFTVNSLADGADATAGNGVCQTSTPGQCTFRAAVEEANALAGSDAINFSVTGTHTISTGLGAVTPGVSGGGNLTITGNGDSGAGTVLDAAGGSGLAFVLDANATGSQIVTLSSLRVRGVNTSGGAGIRSQGGTLTLDHVTSTANTAGAGAGIKALGGTLNVSDSTISGNTNTSGSPGGGIYASGVLNLTRSLVSANNSPTGGAGAIFSSAAGSVISNSTVTGNTSSGSAGAIRADTNTLTIRNTTIASNTSATGSALVAFSTINLGNSIVASAGSSCQAGGGGSFVSAGNNVFTDGTCTSVATDKPSTDPQLHGLIDNGGPTQTMAIYEDSPALNAGSASLCAASPVNNVDQRGVTRPQLSGCDIGAFEYAPYIAPNPPPLPGNKFSFGKLKLKRDGRAILPVTVPGPGVLFVHDAKKRQKLILPGDLSPKTATTVRVKLRPTSHGRARFRAGQPVKTTLNVTFTPNGGAPNHEFLGVKLFKK